jgi:DNA polymerase
MGRWDAYSNYSANDADLCAGIYNLLVRSGRFPVREIAVMDMVIRCATQPKLLLDQQAIARHYAAVQQNKQELLASAMLAGAYNGKRDLMSNEAFADCLRTAGVEPPRKISKTTGLWTYAFAKTDKEFIALEDHPDPMVQTLVAARVGHKSTLEESRSERLLSISNLTWPGNQQRQMPVPLRYGGAHTGRLSGDWKLNMQNLPRGGELRRALIAPPNCKIVTVDASQIEARIVAWLCGERELLQAFRDGREVYSEFATDVFGYPVSKETHPVERFMGKTAILSLGYQVGAIKFQNTIEVQSQLQLGSKIAMTLGEAETIVGYYRHKYHNITNTWRRLQQNGMATLAHNVNGFELGPCKFTKDMVLLPNGLQLNYHDLHYEQSTDFGGEWVFTYGEEPKKLYGGKLLENITQALARIHTMDAAMRIQKKIKLAMQVHDELVYVVHDAYVDEVKQLIKEEMIRPPVWAPDLPLDASVGVGETYGDTK